MRKQNRLPEGGVFDNAQAGRHSIECNFTTLPLVLIQQ
jgi:hypothetical protein